MSDLTVANTILAQLGGNKFTVMTGAKNLMGGSDNLSFRFPQHNGVNYCKITLNAYDTYNVEFGMIRKKDGVPTYTRKEFITDVYNDGLQEVFTAQTGLYTHLY